MLTGEEREVALGEAQAVLDAARPGAYRDDVAALVRSLEHGPLSDSEAGTLERLVELGLQSGRIRALYGPGGEQAALRVYRRLPAGAEAAAGARAVSQALASLKGKELQSVSIAAVGPGAFTLTLAAGEAELAIRLDRQGARLNAVGV